MSITLIPFSQSMWDGFSGAERLPDGSDPRTARTDVEVTDLPIQTEDGEKAGVFILDGGYADGGSGITATINFIDADGMCAYYQRVLAPSATVAGAIEWFQMTLSPKMTHAELLVGGFTLIGPDGEPVE